jgi:Family of unknown function (DUF6433)
MTQTLGEVFVAGRKLTKADERVQHFRKHLSPALAWTLQLAFNDQVKWLLPEGTPPYKPEVAGPGLTESHLMRELRRLYIFLEGGEPGLTQLRRELIFRDMLQILDANETELLISIKDKTFSKQFKCTKAFVEKTFPGLLQQPFNIHFRR